jgi:Zn-dependent protease
MTNGFLHLFRWRGVPVRIHWSVSLLVPLAFGARGNAFASLLGLGTIILVHELGHAVLVHRFELEVIEIRIYPFGGECIHEATQSMREQVIIAWGGVLTQLVLLIGVLGVPDVRCPTYSTSVGGYCII